MERDFIQENIVYKMIYLLFQFCYEFTELGWGSRIKLPPKNDVIKAFGSVVVPIPFFFSSYVPPQPRPVGEEPNLLRLKYTF